MPRQYYSIHQKLSMVIVLEQRLQDQVSVHAVARDLGVDPSQLRRWKKQKNVLEELLLNRSRRSVAARSVHSGRKSCLAGIENELLMFIFQSREQGLAVSVRMVLTRACQLSDNFRQKTTRAKECAMRRFIKSHGIVHRVHTHQSQKNHNEVRGEAEDWIQQMRPMLVGANRDPRFILNMDQTPIFFSMLPRTTLDNSGARTINVRTSTGSTIRVTVAVTVTAAGDMLEPLFVFKGKPGGRIEREFLTYPAGAQYTVQDKAWMDESIMKAWIDRVLPPYVETAPPGIQPILFLDSYRCHMMASVVGAISDLGIQVEHIPGGCTGLCQPVDVGIGKPLKGRVRNLWEDWMVEQGGDTIRFSAPSRERVAGWVVQSLQEISPNIVRRSWRHEPYCLMVEGDNDNEQENNNDDDEEEENNNDDEQQNNNDDEQQNNNNENNNDDGR